MHLRFLKLPENQTLTMIRGVSLNVIGDEIAQSAQRGLRVWAVLFAQQSDKIAGRRKKDCESRRERESARGRVARYIPVHYSNCSTGTQQCVEIHSHCSKVFKKRDRAINPMNMGFLALGGHRSAQQAFQARECMRCTNNAARYAHFPPLSRERMMRRASMWFCRHASTTRPLTSRLCGIVHVRRAAHRFVVARDRCSDNPERILFAAKQVCILKYKSQMPSLREFRRMRKAAAIPRFGSRFPILYCLLHCSIPR